LAKYLFIQIFSTSNNKHQIIKIKLQTDSNQPDEHSRPNVPFGTGGLGGE